MPSKHKPPAEGSQPTPQPQPSPEPKKRKPGRPKKLGRPCKLTPRVAEKICNFIRLGSWLETAAGAVGIDRHTLAEWLKRGERARRSKARDQRERMFARFARQVARAQAEAELLDLERIDSAAEGTELRKPEWQAAAWKLERRYPDRWGRKDQHQHEHAGKGGGPIQTQAGDNHAALDSLPAALREQLLDHLRQRRAATVPVTTAAATVMSSNPDEPRPA